MLVSAEKPIRTCAACRTKRLQGVLVRVARRPDGVISIDTNTHAPGRGVYLCHNPVCVEQAERRHALQRVLHTEVPAYIYDELRRRVLAECTETQYGGKPGWGEIATQGG